MNSVVSCLISAESMSALGATTISLKVALPASDISRVNAVITEPPSLPLNLISLSWTFASIKKSLELFSNSPN